MPRPHYHDTDPGGGKPNSVHADRQGPMRGYFASATAHIPGDFSFADCDDLADVFEKYPELYTEEHRTAVHGVWSAGGHIVDNPVGWIPDNEPLESE